MKWTKIVAVIGFMLGMATEAVAQPPDPSNANVVSGSTGWNASAVGYLNYTSTDSRGFPISGYSNVSIAFSGTYSGVTIAEEQTNDVTGQSGWYAVTCNDGTSAGSATGTNYTCPVFGVRHRIRVSAYTSGTVNARVLLNKYSTLAAYNGSAAKFSSLTVTGTTVGNQFFRSSASLMTFGISGSGDYLNLSANMLELRNGTNAQTFNVYNTYTDASNYERGVFGWVSNNLTIGSQIAGTGAARAINFQIGGVNTWQISGSGSLLALTDNTYDIGASGANRPRNVYVAGQITSSSVVIGASGNTAISFSANNTYDIGTSTTAPRNVFVSNILVTIPHTVAALGTCSLANDGARSFATDASATTFASAVAGGGANHVPVYCDGSGTPAWKEG